MAWCEVRVPRCRTMHLVPAAGEALEAVTVIGAGLAGTEAAWQLAARGIRVRLVEMRPERMPPAHSGGDFAELVCSNSFKSDDPTTAAGVLKRELSALGSIALRVARDVAVPAGAALAVDRALFSQRLTETLSTHPTITVLREEATTIPEGDVDKIIPGGTGTVKRACHNFRPGGDILS